MRFLIILLSFLIVGNMQAQKKKAKAEADKMEKKDEKKDDEKKSIYLRLAALDEEQLERPDSAVDYLWKVLDLKCLFIISLCFFEFAQCFPRVTTRPIKVRVMTPILDDQR